MHYRCYRGIRRSGIHDFREKMDLSCPQCREHHFLSARHDVKDYSAMYLDSPAGPVSGSSSTTSILPPSSSRSLTTV